MTAQAMSAGTVETQSGSGRQPASAVANGDGPQITGDFPMTDTTDQQAVTVAQEAEEIARIIRWIDQAIEHAKKHGATEGVWLFGSQWRMVRAILASVSSASAEHGYVAYGPDGHWHWSAQFAAHESVEDQRPATLLEKRLFNAIRNSTESLSQRALPEGMVAWNKHAPAPKDWDGGNCLNADGDLVIPLTDDRWLSGNIVAYTPSPEPVPATNQAGEALALIREMADPDLQGVSISLHRTWQKQALRIAALDTHAATSQAGGVERIARYVREIQTDVFRGAVDPVTAIDAIRDVTDAALATQPATSQEDARGDFGVGQDELVAGLKRALQHPTGDHDGWTDAGMEDAFFRWPVIVNALNEALASNRTATSQEGEDGFEALHQAVRSIGAATPTPPTLSEDLRDFALVGIERIMREGIHENDGPNRIWINGVAHEGPVADFTIRTFRKVGEIARAALAQVKAS